MNNSIKFVYITVPNDQVASSIGRHLLERRLAACINCLPQMNSMYWWEGNIETGSEIVMIAKTVASKVDELIAEIENIHPYNTPCAVVVNIESGSKDYVDWLKNSIFS